MGTGVDWDHGRQLVWDTARVCHIGDDESSQVSQRRDCRGEILANRFLEIEEDW